jgi:hypothetical protein
MDRSRTPVTANNQIGSARAEGEMQECRLRGWMEHIRPQLESQSDSLLNFLYFSFLHSVEGGVLDEALGLDVPQATRYNQAEFCAPWRANINVVTALRGCGHSGYVAWDGSAAPLPDSLPV